MVASLGFGQALRVVAGVARGLQVLVLVGPTLGQGLDVVHHGGDLGTLGGLYLAYPPIPG